MRHNYFGRKLGRNKDERRRLFMGLMRSLIEKGRIRTTLAKAKAVQPSVEKLITKSKSKKSGALRKVESTLADAVSYNKLLEMAKSRFAGRTSGYTRIVRLGVRRGDASEMVYLEFVDTAPVEQTTTKTMKKAIKETKISSKIQEAQVVSEEKPKRLQKKTKGRRVFVHNGK